MDCAGGVGAFGGDGELGLWFGVGVFDHGEADGDCAEHGGDGGTGDGAYGVLAFFGWLVEVATGEGLEDFLVLGGDALVVEADGDDALFADVSCVHSCDDFLSEVAPFGEVDSGFHESGFGGEVGGSEVDVVEWVSGFDSRGVDGEPSGGFEFFVFEEGYVDRFELVGWDGEGEAGLAGEVEAVYEDFGIVELDGRVGALVDWVGVENLEGEWAVDGDPVERVVDGDLDVLGEDECVEGVGGLLCEVLVEADIGCGI